MTRSLIITGATSGIGRATAERFLDHGWRVGGVGRDEAAFEALRARGEGRFLAFPCDLSDPDRRAALGVELSGAFPTLNALINNAGQCVYEKPSTQSISGWARLLEVNLIAGLDLTQALIKNLRAASAPMIINVSSVTGRFLPAARFAPYAVTKAALDRLTEGLRLELAPEGIRVASVAPGLVKTPIYDTMAGIERLQAQLKKHVPEWLRPEDVAECLEWMISRPAHVNVADVTLLPTLQAR